MKRAILTLGSLLLAASAWAQTGNSTISGVVRDATDAPLPGAAVVVKLKQHLVSEDQVATRLPEEREPDLTNS